MSFPEIKDRYVQVAGSKSYTNDIMNTSMFYSVIGSALHKRKITSSHGGSVDQRIHTLHFQQSRSGKRLALEMARDLGINLGQSYKEEVVFTDAALIGTVDQKALQKMKDKGYVFGDPECPEPVILGSLAKYDLIAFPEAKVMFKTGAFSEQQLEILQMIMDTNGHISKNLAGELEIEYDSPSTLIGTTYFLEEFKEIVLKQGIFQRLMVTSRELTTQERRALNEIIITGEITDEQIKFFNIKYEILPKEDIETALGELSDIIRDKLGAYERGYVLRLDEDAKEVFKDYNNDRMDEVERSFSGSDREIIDSYTTSIIDLQTKLAGVATVLSGKDYIGMDELIQTKPQIDMYFKTVGNDILTRVSEVDLDKIRRGIYNLLKENPEGLQKQGIKTTLVDQFHFSSRKVNLILKQMTTHKEIEKSKNNKYVLVKR
jgi:hypothetical protein